VFKTNRLVLPLKKAISSLTFKEIWQLFIDIANEVNSLDDLSIVYTKAFSVYNWLLLGNVTPFYMGFEEMFTKKQVSGERFPDVVVCSKKRDDYYKLLKDRDRKDKVRWFLRPSDT
jgi:hypothetical protein